MHTFINGQKLTCKYLSALNCGERCCEVWFNMNFSGLLSEFEAELCIDFCVCRMCFHIAVLMILLRAAQSLQIIQEQRRQSSHQLQRRNTRTEATPAHNLRHSHRSDGTAPNAPFNCYKRNCWSHCSSEAP